MALRAANDPTRILRDRIESLEQQLRIAKTAVPSSWQALAWAAKNADTGGQRIRAARLLADLVLEAADPDSPTLREARGLEPIRAARRA